MTHTMTEKLLAELNAKKGLRYPDIGYSYWADIKCDGNYSPMVWTIINEIGGVTISDLNAKQPHMRCRNIRHAILGVK